MNKGTSGSLCSIIRSLLVHGWPRKKACCTCSRRPNLAGQGQPLKEIKTSSLIWFGILVVLGFELTCTYEAGTLLVSHTSSPKTSSIPKLRCEATTMLKMQYSRSQIKILRSTLLVLSFCFSGWCWGLNSGPMPWATPQPPTPLFFVMGFLRQGLCLGWLQTAILLISAPLSS
jgi:hypothetical protein